MKYYLPVKLVNLITTFSLLILVSSCSSLKQTTVQSYKDLDDRETFRLVFYNVENLFDTKDDSLTNDEEFLPEGLYKWTDSRLYEKVQKLSKVIIASGGWETPDIVGLCEVENRDVVNYLINATPIKKSNYGLIHKESPDSRGIDVALLYKKSSFKPVFYDFHEIVFQSDDGKTRDILYAKGLVKKGDTIHIFVNHWPSRRGGQTESEPRRMFVACLLKSKVDSIFKIDANAKIIIMGDFNDEPTDISITQGLGVVSDSNNLKPMQLFNMVSRIKNEGRGSYKFQFQWNQIDQFIISYSLLKNQSGKLYTKFDDAEVFSEDWILTDDQKYPGKKPFRTYIGPKYLGGYSDHLPIYLDIRFRDR